METGGAEAFGVTVDSPLVAVDIAAFAGMTADDGEWLNASGGWRFAGGVDVLTLMCWCLWSVRLRLRADFCLKLEGRLVCFM